MAVISWGYSGPLYQENWARLASLGGDRYNVGPETNPFGVVAISGSRRISVGAGTALASGVLCELATMEVIDLPAIDAGTSRFYLAVLRRTWGESPVSTLELLYASATANVTVPTAPPASFPETFASTPGTMDDQPLAWVWYNGTNNTVAVFKLSGLTKENGSVGSEWARDYLFPNPVQGNRVYRADLGYEEAYFGLYNVTSNPGGRAAAGWLESILHAEFTTLSNGNPDGSIAAGSVTNDPAMSTNTAFATAISQGVRLTTPGLYALHWRASLGASMTGRSYLAIAPTSGEVARSSGQTGEDTTTVSIPNLYITAATDVVFNGFKTTGGSTTVTGRIRVTKIR
jgi:hypothetical protein